MEGPESRDMQPGHEQGKETMKALCAGDCGKTLTLSRSSLPPGQATCQECRNAKPKRKHSGPHYRACAIYPRNCTECGKPFIARRFTMLCCSGKCSDDRRARRNNKSTPRTRNKGHVRRSLEKYSDITPAYEAVLRSRTRKCRLCATYMTGKPDHPNSKHLDHIIPIGVGGTHTIGNVRIICRTCNLKRPKDGSDLTGWQPTLWAQVPGVVIKPKPAPAPPPPRVAKARCSCGNEITNGQTSRCAQCLHRLTVQAAAMRDHGMKWQEICDALGYTNTGALYSRVMQMRKSAVG